MLCMCVWIVGLICRNTWVWASNTKNAQKKTWNNSGMKALGLSEGLCLVGFTV